jgi:protein-glutamine gamma-glutamyltransferase
MDFAPVSARLARFLEALPVLAALALNAVAHGRWLFNALLMLGVLGIVALGRSVEHRSGRMLATGAVGVALGFVGFLLAPPPPGPIPPVVLSPLALGLAGLCVFCVLSQSRTYAWVYAWLLAVLSANVALTPEVGVGLLALALATVLAVASAGRVLQAGAGAIAGFALFAALTGFLTWQLSLFIRASEGWLMESLARLTSGAPVQTLEPKSVDLPARTTAPLQMDPLFELEGAAPRHLRTGVLEHFDGRRWWETQESRERKLTLPGGEGQPLTLNFLAPLGRTIPSPAGVRSLDAADVVVRGGWVLQGDALGGKSVKLVRGEEALPNEEPYGQTALPKDLEAELAPLSAQLLAGTTTARAQAEALEKFFSSNFTYSLTVDLKGPAHPITNLVKERRAAYCSYFASAMVALLRTQGLRARMVTGFAPAETNSFTGRTLVRARDAHAWVEVYLPEEKRWAAFDPTPWYSRDEALAVQRQKGFLGNALDAVLSALRRAWAKVRYTPGDALVAVASSPVTWALVALAAFFVFRNRLRAERREKTKGYSVAVDPKLREAYARYLKLLERAGVTRSPAETDDEVLRKVSKVSPDTAAAAAQFLYAFRRERFRAQEAAPLEEALQNLKSSVEASLSR